MCLGHRVGLGWELGLASCGGRVFCDRLAPTASHRCPPLPTAAHLELRGRCAARGTARQLRGSHGLKHEHEHEHSAISSS